MTRSDMAARSNAVARGSSMTRRDSTTGNSIQKPLETSLSRSKVMELVSVLAASKLFSRSLI